MKVRAIDANNDWTFGKGKSNYKTGRNACAQNIKTALQCLINDCFFATTEGIDWFNRLGGKNIIQTKLDVAATIIKVPDVTSIEEISANIDVKRNISIQYAVNSIYGRISNTFTPEV